MNESKVINQTVLDLSQAIHTIVKDLPIEYEIKETTTNNYELMCKQYNNTKVLEVSSEGCEDSIYGNSFINILSRVFHDYIHITKHLSFSKEDEIKVAKIQRGMIFNTCKLLGMSNLRAENASQLLYLDIEKQVKYYYKHKKFVSNQFKFIMDYFKYYLYKTGQ